MHIICYDYFKSFKNIVFSLKISIIMDSWISISNQKIVFHTGFLTTAGAGMPNRSHSEFLMGLSVSTGLTSHVVSLRIVLIWSSISSSSTTVEWVSRASNSLDDVDLRMMGNLWQRKMQSWTKHFCLATGSATCSKAQNTSAEYRSLLGSPQPKIGTLISIQFPWNPAG